MPKKIARDIARQVKQLGEEVVEELKDLPGGMAREAGEQIGMLPRGWGEEERETQPSIRLIQEKKKEEERGLAFARKRIKELEARKPESEEAPEEVERQRKLAEEAEKRRPVPEVSKKRKVPLGVELRTKKSRAEFVHRKVSG